MMPLVRGVSGVYLDMLNRRTFVNDLTRHEAYLRVTEVFSVA